MRNYPFYAALFVLLCFGCISSSAQNKNHQFPVAKNGLIDLRKQTFRYNIPLNGQWVFYWKQLLDPNDTTAKGGIPVNFPFMWNGYELNGEKLPSWGYATYRVRVLLPKSDEPIRIGMPDVYCAYRLFINGKEIATNGRVSTNRKDFVPHWIYNGIDLDNHPDTLNITLQIANFVHSRGGISKEILIGDKAVIQLDRLRGVAFDLVLTGCLFMGGLFFLGLYTFGNRDKAILLFALFSIVYSYRLIGVDNYVLHSLLPNINWYITTRVEYLSLFGGIGLFGLYTRCLYPRDISRIILYTISSACFVFALSAILLPPIYFTQLVNPFLVVMIFCLLYVPYVYSRAYKNNRPGSGYAMVSSLALMMIFGISLLHYWGITSQLRMLSFMCYVSFFFLQSLVLSHRVSFVLTRARQQAEQGLRAKSEFLSTMSHEIRTPLNSVIGMSHLLLKNDPRPDQVEQLDVMLFSANNLLAIVNDILDYNKIEAGKIAFEHIEMDIVAIARNIVAGLHSAAQDKGIELKLTVNGELKNKILGDPTRIFQVITNLVHNAIKFTSKGYVELVITVTGQTDTLVTLRIDVKDTGIGISREKQRIIFERFTQADSSTSRGFGGTGLGLAISKRILELQNATLQLASEEGKGSTFYFSKTFEKSIKTIAQQQIERNKPKQDDKPLTGISILVVDDNPMNVLVAQRFLQRWGATIDVAVNGQEALDKLDITRHKLVLMDLHMPVMDGYESSIQMRANGVTIPIIALTANLPAEVEAKVKECGIDDIVVKPFPPDELFRKVLLYLADK